MALIDLKKLAGICKLYRKENNLTQTKMAEILSINDQIYGRIEREQHLPRVEQIEKILEVTGSDVFDITETNTPQDVFVALKGEAKSDEEKMVFDRLIQMILCLEKHKYVREVSNGHA